MVNNERYGVVVGLLKLEVLSAFAIDGYQHDRFLAFYKALEDDVSVTKHSDDAVAVFDMLMRTYQ